MFSIKIVGRENLEDSLNRLKDMDRTVIEPGSYKWFQGLRAKLKSKPYPPRTATQTYVRTGNLANSWGVGGGNGNWYVRNSADYSEWVVGDDQAKVHKGRWWKVRDVVEENTDGLGDVLIKEIEGQWH